MLFFGHSLIVRKANPQSSHGIVSSSRLHKRRLSSGHFNNSAQDDLIAQYANQFRKNIDTIIYSSYYLVEYDADCDHVMVMETHMEAKNLLVMKPAMEDSPSCLSLISVIPDSEPPDNLL